MGATLISPHFQKASIEDVKLSKLPFFADESARLVVFEGKTSGKSLERTFFIKASEKLTRGRHAHKACDQWLICVQGKVTVLVHDGKNEAVEVLEDSARVLHIPAGVWASQEYEADSILLVLTDSTFSEDDYIRSWQEFLILKGIQ